MSDTVKATVSFTVYLHKDEVPEFKRADLETLLYEISEGIWVGGNVQKSEPVEVPDESLREELVSIGNYGAVSVDGDEDDDKYILMTP